MKKLFFAVLFISAMGFKSADAQFSIHLNLNLGDQPEWGPTGYDHAEYYYMPDIDTYYDVPHHQYVYMSHGRWTRGAALPPRYANYDMYHSYKAVINSPAPYMHADVYRAKYANYRGRHDQQIIRDSHDEHYRNHWQGDHRDDHHDNGNHNGDRNHDDHRDDHHDH
jgi:hypothetical protein